MGQYKEIVVAQPRSTNPIEQQKTQVYRGVSTINQNSKSFALYDIELIKQDLINHYHQCAFAPNKKTWIIKKKK